MDSKSFLINSILLSIFSFLFVFTFTFNYIISQPTKNNIKVEASGENSINSSFKEGNYPKDSIINTKNFSGFYLQKQIDLADFLKSESLGSLSFSATSKKEDYLFLTLNIQKEENFKNNYYFKIKDSNFIPISSFNIENSSNYSNFISNLDDKDSFLIIKDKKNSQIKLVDILDDNRQPFIYDYIPNSSSSSIFSYKNNNYILESDNSHLFISDISIIKRPILITSITLPKEDKDYSILNSSKDKIILYGYKYINLISLTDPLSPKIIFTLEKDLSCDSINNFSISNNTYIYSCSNSSKIYSGLYEKDSLIPIKEFSGFTKSNISNIKKFQKDIFIIIDNTNSLYLLSLTNPLSPEILWITKLKPFIEQIIVDKDLIYILYFDLKIDVFSILR